MNVSFRIFLISLIMVPRFPIRHPIRDVGTSNLVVNDVRPESLSTFSLHLGCKRNAASTVGEICILKKLKNSMKISLYLGKESSTCTLQCKTSDETENTSSRRNWNHAIITFSSKTINFNCCTRFLSNLIDYDTTLTNNTSNICSRTQQTDRKFLWRWLNPWSRVKRRW